MPANLDYLLQARRNRNRYAQTARGGAGNGDDPLADAEEEAFQTEKKRLAEQSKSDEADAKAYEKGRKDAEKEALRARNNEMEAKARREKRPIYTDADGVIQSQYTDDEWEAQKQRKAKNDRLRTQYFKEQRPWVEDAEGNMIPRHTDEEWKTLQSEKAAKEKAKQLDEQAKVWREQKGQALTTVDDQAAQVMRGLDLEGQDLTLQHKAKLDTVKKANAQIKKVQKEIEEEETETEQRLDAAAIAKRKEYRDRLVAERDKVQAETDAAEAKLRAHEVRKLEYSRANNEVQGWLQKQKHGLKTEMPPVVMGVKTPEGLPQKGAKTAMEKGGADQSQSQLETGAPSTEVEPKAEAVRKAVIEGRIAALAEDDSLSDEERKAGLTKLMLQRDDPQAYETQVMQEFEGLPPEQLNQALDTHVQDFEMRKQDWQARRDALKQQTQAVNAEVDSVLARNAQRLQQPHKAADLITYTTADGGKVSVFKDLAPQLEQAQEKAGTFEKQHQGEMDRINAEGGELERAAKLIHAGGGVLQKKQETARVAAQAERQKVYEQLNALPGAKLGDELAQVDAAVAKHQGGDDVSLHEWAAKEREKIAAKAQAVQKKVGTAVQEAYAAASAKMPAGVDLNGELDRDPLGLEGPASESGVTKLLEKMGLPSSKENREMAVKLLRDAAVLDWSRGDTSAPVRTDSAGRVLVNPERWTDDKAYAEAVAGAGASEAEKAKALEMQPELKAQAIKLKLDTLRTLGVFNDWEQAEVEPTREEKMKAEANGTTAEPRMVHAGLSDEEKLKLFEKENSGVFSTGAWKVRWNQALLGAAQGVIGLWQSATGLAAPFSDDALDLNRRLGKDAAQIGAASQALPTGQWVNQGASMLVSSAPALAVGGAVGAATRSETLALHGAAAGAGLQTFGQVYGDAVQGYMQNKGLSKAEARQAALVPALASGMSTYALTAAGGTNGMESVLRQEGFKQGLKQWLATVGKGALKEGVLEEGPDQLIQGVLARHSYDPTKSWDSIWKETATAVIGGALMGGGFEALAPQGMTKDQARMPNAGDGGGTTDFTGSTDQRPEAGGGQDVGPVDESGPEFISRRGLEIAAQKRLEQLREKRDGSPGNEEMTLPGGIKVPATITQNGVGLSKQEETEFQFLEKHLAQDQIDHSALANAYNKKLKTPKTAGANSAAPPAAATAPKSQWQRPARLDSQNRRQLEKEAEAAIDQLPEDQQADAIEKLIRLKRQHADMRAEIADADAGEARVLEADIVDVENKMRRLAGQSEVANSPPVTPEDQAKERARIQQRAEEIQAKITAGKEITAGDRQDWDLAGRDVNELPPTPAGKPSPTAEGAGRVVTPAGAAEAGVQRPSKPEARATAQEAQAELASFAPEGMEPQQVEATKAKAGVLLRMAQGKTLEDFTDEELRTVGLNRDGTPGHYETVPVDKKDPSAGRTSVWKKGVRPDGFQPVVVKDGGKELIITQRQIENLKKRLPAVAAQIGKSEVERRQEIAAKGVQAEDNQTFRQGDGESRNQSPLKTGATGAEPAAATDKESLTVAAPESEAGTGRSRAAARQTAEGSPEGERERIIARATPEAFDPAVEQRVDEIATELSSRGLSGEQALKAARGVVQRMGVMGPKYEVQMIDPAFEDAMKAEGFQRDPAKMTRWMVKGQFKAETQAEKAARKATPEKRTERTQRTEGTEGTPEGQSQSQKTEADKSRAEARQTAEGSPEGERERINARATPLIERSDWKQAQGEVIGVMQARAKGLAEAGKKAASEKIKAVVKRFNKLEELIDTQFGRLFEGVRIVPNGSLAGSGGLAAQVMDYDAQGRATGVELLVDAAAFAENGGITDAELERTLNEEWQHRADLMVMSRSEAIALARDIHAAQPGVFNAAWKQYYAVQIKEGSMPAKPPVDLTEDEAYRLYFEASRMIRQGTFTTENAAIRDVGLLQRMYLMLSRYVNFVRREMKKLPQDLRELWEDKLTAAEGVMNKTKQAGIRLQKEHLDEVEPPEQTAPKPKNKKPVQQDDDEEALAMAADAEMDVQPARKGALRNPGENAIRGMAAIPDPDTGKENVVVWINRYHGRITRPSKGWLARMAQDGKDRSKMGDWDDIQQAEIPSFYAGLVFKNGNGSTLDQALQELHGLGYFPGVAAEDVTGEMLARKIKDVIQRYQAKKQGGATTVQDEEQAHFERLEAQRVEFERSTAKGPIYVKPHEMQPGDVMMVKADDGKMHRVEVLRLDTEPVPAGEEFDPDANPAQFMGTDGPMEIRSVTLKDGTTFGVQTIDGQQGLYVDAFSVRQEGDFYAGLSEAVRNRTIDDADAVLRVMQHEGMDATTPFSQIVLAIQQNLRVPMKRAQKMLAQVMDTDTNATVWTNEELKQALESPLGAPKKQGSPKATHVMPDGYVLTEPGMNILHSARKRAYHGTPHKVDKFSLDKIGTGEGAQAYGWGLYFAGNKAVAQNYQKGLTERDFIRKIREEFSEHDSQEDALDAIARLDLSEGQRALIAALEKEDWWGFDYPHQAVQAAIREPQNFDPGPDVQAALEKFGNLYTVDLLPDEEEFLDWDKPLSDVAAKKISTPNIWALIDPDGYGFTKQIAGHRVYQILAQKLGPKEASQLLASSGIPGIRYLDGNSRSEGSGTRNFVIFDDKLVRILEENGRPVEQTLGAPKKQSGPGLFGEDEMNFLGDRNTLGLFEQKKPTTASTPPSTFSLEASTPEQLKAEAERKVLREKLQARAEKPLVGTLGDIGQTQMFGGGDLFAQTGRLSSARKQAGDQAKNPFYSKLEQVIEQKMPNRADAKTIMGILSNPSSAIKAEELKWSGIVPWLDEWAKKSPSPLSQAGEVSLPVSNLSGSPLSDLMLQRGRSPNQIEESGKSPLAGDVVAATQETNQEPIKRKEIPLPDSIRADLQPLLQQYSPLTFAENNALTLAEKKVNDHQQAIARLQESAARPAAIPSGSAIGYHMQRGESLVGLTIQNEAGEREKINAARFKSQLQLEKEQAKLPALQDDLSRLQQEAAEKTQRYNNTLAALRPSVMSYLSDTIAQGQIPTQTVLTWASHVYPGPEIQDLIKKNDLNWKLDHLVHQEISRHDPIESFELQWAERQSLIAAGASPDLYSESMGRWKRQEAINKGLSDMRAMIPHLRSWGSWENQINYRSKLIAAGGNEDLYPEDVLHAALERVSSHLAREFLAAETEREQRAQQAAMDALNRQWMPQWFPPNQPSSPAATADWWNDFLSQREEEERKPAQTFVAKVWRSIAGHDEAFQFGRSSSRKATDIATAVSLPGKLVTATGSGDTLRFMGTSGYLDIHDADTDRPYIRSTEAGSKGKQGGGGTQLYQAALDWIHNNGKTIKNDPGGITNINAIRRTSNFASSALRWGTTKHLKPHSAQKVPWSKNAALNTAALLTKEMDNALKAVAEAHDWQYDFTRGDFLDSTGNPVGQQRINSAVLAAHPGDSGIGLATLERALITRSAIAAFQRGETESVVSQVGSGESLPDRLTGVLYSTRKQAGGFTAGLQEGLRAAAAGKGRGGLSTADIVQAYRAATVGQDGEHVDVFVKPGTPAGDNPPITHVMPDGYVLTAPGMTTLHSPRKRAYHGTPHKVDRFSMEKIGTGEGAQAYGWGLYFAGNKAVAQQYQKGLTERDFIRKIREEFSEHDDQETALEVIHGLDLSEGQRALIDALAKEDWWGFDFPHQAVQAAIREPQNFDPGPDVTAALEKFGNLYTVDLLPDEAEFLDWDKPLAEQSENIRSILRKNGLTETNPDVQWEAQTDGKWGSNGLSPTGESLYKALKISGDKAASDKLLKLGIPGIRYLDGNSRGDGEGSSNYVLFDEKLVRIIAENGKPVETQALASPRKQAGDGSQSTLKREQRTGIDAAAHEAATSPRNDLAEPTAAQKEAGNYAKGHVTIGGHEISIENPAGSRRRPEWPVLRDHYGYLKGTNGQDGDHVDIFVKPGTPADYEGPVHVVRQNVVENGKATGRLDEYKVMLGYPTAEEARAAYLRNYTTGWPGLAKLTTHTMPEFEVIKRSVFGGAAGARATDKALASPRKQGQGGGMADPEQAAQNAEPSPGGLSEAEVKKIVMRSDLFWRVHDKRDPFTPEDAVSNSIDGTSSKKGFSTFHNADDLVRYWLGYNPAGRSISHYDQQVIAFSGKNAGTGIDGEPLVIPDMKEVHRLTFRKVRDAVNPPSERINKAAEEEGIDRANFSSAIEAWNYIVEDYGDDDAKSVFDRADVAYPESSRAEGGTLEAPRKQGKALELLAKADWGRIDKALASPQKQGQVTPVQDAEYLQAVKDGDVAKQQAMVDAAAKAAGYTVGPVWHGTEQKGLTEFYGGWWSDNRKVTREFGSQRYAAYLKGPLADGDMLRQLYKEYNGTDIDPDSEEPLYDSEIADDAMAGSQFQDLVRSKGFQGIEVWDESNAEPGMAYAVFEPNQIKSADPITRDAKGNVIPLSQRFNSESDSILYAPRKQAKALEMLAKADWGRIDKALTGRLATAVTDAAAWIKKQALPGEQQVNPIDAALELLSGWSVTGQMEASGAKFKDAQKQELMAQTRRQMRRMWNMAVRQLVPDASLPADVLAKKREMTMNQALSNEVALDIGQRALAGKPKLSDLVVGEAQQNPEIRRKMFLAMNPRIDSGVTMESLNPEERRVAEALLKLRDDLGRRMVKAGRIGLQTYEAMREGTSHYYDHDVKREKSLLRQMSMGLRNLFAQTATAYHIVDTQTKQPDGSPALVMHPGNMGRPTYRFDTQEQMRGFYEEFIKDQILQASEKGNAGRYPWMTPADKAALMGVTRDSLNNPGRMSPDQRAVVARLQEQLRDRFEKRMPLSYDEHSKAGLIEDPFYSVARQIAEMGHDVATAEFFNSIAAVPDYVRDAPTIGYTEMPDTAKLGALAGKYVRDDVAAEVQQLTELPGMGMKFYDALLGLFKTGKTVLNPGSHGRNIVGNIAFAHLAGSNPLNPGNATYYAEALRVLRDGGADYKEMYESGVLGGDFLTGEVKRSLRQLVPDAATVLREAESGNLTWLYGLKEHMARRWQGLLKKPGQGLELAATAWRLEDDIYKAAAYLKAKGMGMTSKEAAEHVREWFPYYDKGTSGTLKFLGRLAFPFLSFKRESFRILKNGLTKKPLATIATLALPRLLTQIALTMAEMRLLMWTLGLGLKDERDKEDVLKALKGRAGRLLSPIAGDSSLFSILLPWRDDNGGLQQWDLSNTHPFGDWLATRTEDAESQEPWVARQVRELMTGSPFLGLLVEFASNQDSFTGRRIYESDMSTGEAHGKLLEHAFTELAPPITPTIPLPGGVKLEGTSARTIRKAFEQSPSKLAPARNPTQALIRTLVGLDVRPADPNLYDDVAKYREKNKLPAVPRGQQFPSDAVGRARAELYRLLIQPEPDVPAVKAQLEVLTKHGAKIPSVQDLFKDRQPQDVMKLKKHQARWMNQLAPEARRVLEAAQAQQSGAKPKALDAMAKARAGV